MPSPILLILVDGMRPDALMQVEAPAIQRLLEEGASSLVARTVFPSVTLPCIMSIFHSVQPEIHGTVGNLWNSAEWYAPGLFDLFHESGRKTASFYNWEQLRDLSRPGALDVSLCLNNSEAPALSLGAGDEQLTSLALPFLASGQFDFAFVYLGCTDTAGHRHGWLSAEYMHTLENADRCIGRILEVVPAASRVVIASDHGGHGTSHGSDTPEDMTVPLVFNGLGIKPGKLSVPVSTLDIAPTLAHLAGLTPPGEWLGRNLL
jgi:predicted AlkP superfamily pyrophosphatase or phosphodiesterase